MLKPAVFLFAIAAFAGGAGADEAEDRAAGADVAQELCSGCHIVAEGQAGPVPDGVPPFPVIANRPGRTDVGFLSERDV